jgi:hypothetical protein
MMVAEEEKWIVSVGTNQTTTLHSCTDSPGEEDLEAKDTKDPSSATIRMAQTAINMRRITT